MLQNACEDKGSVFLWISVICGEFFLLIRSEKCALLGDIRSEKCNEPPIIRLEKCNESRKRIVAKDFRHTAHSDKWKRLSLTRSKSISYSDRASGHAFA